MAKTVEDLRKSRQQREAIIKRFGKVPESIMVHDKSDKVIDIIVSERRSYELKAVTGGHTGKLGKAFSVSGKTCRGGAADPGGLSRFPQNIGRTLLFLYTNKGDTVVDPFAGHNSRMELCWRAGRNYIGHDLSAEFMEINRKIKQMLEDEKKNDFFPGDFTASITLHECDSKKMPTKSGVGDFTITSPPYWDLEYYGPQPEQLGIGKTYEEFLNGLGQVAKENFRCLKPGAFCVWCVNDFRKGGLFYPYHEHTCQLLRAAGFIQWDMAITDLGSSMRACFPNQVIESKILPKRHEYCLIFRKPQVKLLTPPKRK